MPSRNILLCFDAFGTLFAPRLSIPEQYAAVARQCGLDGFTVADLKVSFKTAFSRQSAAHPNYGRASNMGAEKWWTNVKDIAPTSPYSLGVSWLTLSGRRSQQVIHDAFQPLIGTTRPLPLDLAPKLLHRFSSSEGYGIALDSLPQLLSSVKRGRAKSPGSDQVVVGVITNSDDRVPKILSSLGLDVSPLRFGSTDVDPFTIAQRNYHIDFHCISYDVGLEKPDRRIFEAAEGVANRVVAARKRDEGSREGDRPDWLKIYVGDEFKKDVQGALGAGWNAVLVGEEPLESHEHLEDLDDYVKAPVEDVFKSSEESPVSLKTETLEKLLQWLSR